MINGASDLLVQIWGDRGRHARSAVGMAELPGSICVEIELIVKLGELKVLLAAASSPRSREEQAVSYKHLGILGVSAEGAALCYRTFCQEARAARWS